MFVDGTFTFQGDIVIGPGCIVATGDIDKLAPKTNTGSSGNGVLLFTLGTANFLQPMGEFYGWIVAKNGVTVKSGNDENLSYNRVNPYGNSLPPEDFDFPGLNGPGGPAQPPESLKILTWKTTY